MLEMIGIMQKLHLYHSLVEKYEYLFYFIILHFFLLLKMTGEVLPPLPLMTARVRLDSKKSRVRVRVCACVSVCVYVHV